MVMESILFIVTQSHIVQNVQIRRNLIVVFFGTAKCVWPGNASIKAYISFTTASSQLMRFRYTTHVNKVI